MDNENEKVVVEEEQQENGTNEAYIKEIKDLKAKSVSKEDYDKLKTERDNLIKALVDGEEIEVEKNENENTNINEEISKLRASILTEDSDMSNLDYWANALSLRKKIIERDGEDADPFLPNSSQVDVTEADKQAVDRVVSVVEDCIEKANGDNAAFVALMTASIKDDPISKANARKK